MKKVKALLKDVLFVLIAVYLFLVNRIMSHPFWNVNVADQKVSVIIYALIWLLLGAVCIMSGTEAKNKGKIVRMVFYYIVAVLAFLSSIYQIIIEINFLFNATF